MDAESERLLAAFLEGGLSEEDARRLLERLDRDPALLDEAAAQWRVDRLLEAAADEDASVDAVARSVRAALEGSKVSLELSRRVAARLRSRRRAEGQRSAGAFPWIAAAAAALLVVGLGVALSGRGTSARPIERAARQAPLPDPEPEPEVSPPAPEPPPTPPSPRPLPPAPPELPSPPPPPPPPAPEPERPAPKPTVAAVARLESAQGGVHVAGVAARGGQDLLEGQGVETGAEGTAVVVLGDGTRIELFPGTRLGGLAGSRVSLASGRLSAEVARRAAADPLVFETPNAEATVLGTRLLLAAEAPGTRLEVAEGRVRVERRDDRASVVVGADQAVVVSRGVALEARPRPAVLGLTLINADTNQPVPGFAPIRDGAVLNLSRLPTRNLNVRADVNGAAIGCVQFGWDGNELFNTERESPYGLVTSGDRSDPFSAWTPPAGAHTLTATPWSGPPAAQKRGGTGLPGRAFTIRFTVVDR